LRRSNSFQHYSSYLPPTQSYGNSIVAGIIRQEVGATGVRVDGGAYAGYAILFHMVALGNESFRKGDYTTHFVEE